MTKSFPKAAANADAVPLPGAKPIGEKVRCQSIVLLIVHTATFLVLPQGALQRLHAFSGIICIIDACC